MRKGFIALPILIFAAAIAVGLVGWLGIEKSGLSTGSVGLHSPPFMSTPVLPVLEQSVPRVKLSDILKLGSDQNKEEFVNQFFPAGEDILAQSITTVYGPKIFRLKDFPGMVFKILKVIKATGSAPSPSLGLCYDDTASSPEYDRQGFIILRPHNFSFNNGVGTNFPICFDSTTMDGLIKPAIFVEIEVINGGEKALDGNYLLEFDNDVHPGRETLAVSPDERSPMAVPASWSGTFYYSFGGLSSEQQEIRLVFGNYGMWLGLLGEDRLSKSEGGFIINFTNKTISEIPG